MNEQNCTKKAILVVSFGTTYPETLAKTITRTEEKIKEAFPAFEVRRAFTSRTVIRRLAERDNLQIETEQQALERLRAEGFTEIYVQPLHVVAGAEYEKIKRMVVHLAHQKPYIKIKLARPLLYSLGQDGHPDDYELALRALEASLPTPQDGQAVVLMGHGGMHPANAAYAALQLKMEGLGWQNRYVYTVEGFPALADVMAKLKATQRKKVWLQPFMLVAGDHAINDMAGDEDDSAKAQLLQAGFQVDVNLCGLGELPAIQEIYVQHLREAMRSAAAHGGHACHGQHGQHGHHGHAPGSGHRHSHS